MGLPIWGYGIGAIAVVLAVNALYSAVRSGGYDQCRSEVAAKQAAAQSEDHKNYLAAVAWGNQVSASLAQAQRRIADLKGDHENGARVIPGFCPDGLRLLHDAAATGVYLPDPTGASLRTPAVVAASAIGVAVADNYARARDCEARLNALIDWHEKHSVEYSGK